MNIKKIWFFWDWTKTKNPVNKQVYRVLIGVDTLFLWYQLESNQRHKDFQSFALPTELWYPAWGCKCSVFFYF